MNVGIPGAPVLPSGTPGAAAGTSTATALCSIIVPTYHEAENVQPLCDRIRQAMSAASLPYEIILVDDDSQDGAEQAVHAVAEQGTPVRIIVRKNERGLSSAVIRGFNEAKGSILVCMDADLSHPPEKLPELITQLQVGAADFVMGSRYVPGGSTEQGWGVGRWLNSKIATLLARPFTKARDPMSGFFAMTREQFSKADTLSPVGYKIALELLVKGHCRRVAEIPIHFANRTRGQSKLSFKEQWNYIRHVKRLADYKYGKLSRFAQFCFVGSTGVAVDLSVFACLFWLSAGLYLARAAAILVAMTWNFWVNRRLTFSYGRTQAPFRQYLRFVATCSVGAVVNWSVAVGLVKLAGTPIYGAAILGILAGTVFNFMLSMHWVFGGRPKGI